MGNPGGSAGGIRSTIRTAAVALVSRCLHRFVRDPEAFLAAISAALRRRGRLPDRVRRAHNGSEYAVPRELEVTAASIERVLVLGSCLVEAWLPFIPVPVDYVGTNNFHELPESAPRPLDAYDFQIVQIPLRSVIEDDLFWHCSWTDSAQWEGAYQHALARLRLMLSLRLAWNQRSGLLTFVTNFQVPQRNPAGRTLERYDLRNPVYFVERLNESLANELAAYGNTYVLDVDELASLFGKKYVQDDGIDPLNHASVLAATPVDERDARRLEPIGAIGEYYEVRSDLFLEALWLECVAMYRTIKRIDAVKLVIVDLDDTLWRGVLADDGVVGVDAYEGWPLGIIEALLYLKMRGVLLAVVSKNDEARVVAAWEEMFGGRIRLDDFAIHRINWRPKSENVREILDAVNLLPESAVFIDDNPRERAEVHAAFPAIRLLGVHPYSLRRILLWAPETQVPEVTHESADRTAMVRAQVRRESARSESTLTEFLSTLELRVRMTAVRTMQDSHAARAFELLNKTNQFNTTGRRWSHEELRAAFERDAVLYCFDVRDRFTDYGLVGAVVVESNAIEQFVMSCRVFGLDVEAAVLAELVAYLRRCGVEEIRARLQRTQVNQPCHDLYARCGFREDGSNWFRSSESPIERPPHIMLQGLSEAEVA